MQTLGMDVTRTLSFGGFIEGLASFVFTISGKLMGCLDLGDLASASQDEDLYQPQH